MKLMLHVAPSIVRYPLIASVILETGALVNIERASIDAVSGEIVLEVPSDKCLEVKEAFERRGVKVVPLEIPVIRDENECVHCGACVSICPTKHLPLRGLAGRGRLGQVHSVRSLHHGLPSSRFEAGLEIDLQQAGGGRERQSPHWAPAIFCELFGRSPLAGLCRAFRNQLLDYYHLYK